MISEAIDFKYLLIENYRKLKLKETELATIFVIDHLINQGNPFITADILALKMTLDVDSIDKILADLLTRGYIAYVTENEKTITSLEPLKQILYHEFQISLSKDESEKQAKTSNELENIFDQFQKILGRSLSPVEISKIREWVSLGYAEETIINALKDSINKGNKSLRSVDKILLSYSARDDIQSNGFTSINKNWDKNLEETIRIAKTRWVDDDDDN